MQLGDTSEGREQEMKSSQDTYEDVLIMWRNNLGDLSKGAFKHSPYLTHLNLQGCRIHSVREGAFRGLSRLVQLDLTHNNIDILYQESFDGLSSVKQLYLDRNRIEEINPGAFASLSSLNLLSLTHNQLVYLPNMVFQSDARHATCEERGHTKVLTGFPGTILLLNMRGNHFHYLPGNSFPNVPKVVSLHLDGCKIHDIEGGAFQGMKVLIYLYLSDNQLASLDTNVFAGAHNIMYLHLEGNRLSQFPSSEMLAHIPKLGKLSQTFTLIVKLEPVGLLNPIPQLTGLYLANNTITNIVPRALDSAPYLDVLHLGDNKLTEVPSDALGEAPLLTEVSLSGNLIRWIGPRAFRGVATGLKHLYLDRMGLQKMSAKSLAWFGPSLVSLSLEENQLEELPDLSSLTRLQHLTLGNNPLMCDCKLLPFYRWLSNASLKVEAVCGYPSELRGQSVIKADVLINCSGENNVIQ
ncbi:hypothetical protein E1301_Tti004760 [Triplophysa tibetana]|uniref:LRRCT domain-containing protein n=1 Tax=Triplophysa tibetana TaxID=1572043 RepID=A0A5A9NC87_9TELE|nr:hypothetical protein E1301_Tti004760 [Triplophysa tibetana]